MTWLIASGIFILGLIVGLLCHYILPIPAKKEQALSAKIQAQEKVQDDFKQEVNDYMQSVNHAIQNIALQAQHAAQQSQEKLAALSATQQANKDFVPFFSEEVSTLIQSNEVKDTTANKSHNTINDAKPLDYADAHDHDDTDTHAYSHVVTNNTKSDVKP